MTCRIYGCSQTTTDANGLCPFHRDELIDEWSFAFTSRGFPDGVRYAYRHRRDAEGHYHTVLLNRDCDVTQPLTMRRCRRDGIRDRIPEYDPLPD